MRGPPAAEILGAGIVSLVGLTAGTTAAAIRAGITLVRESPLRNRNGEPLVAGFLEEGYLPPLSIPWQERLEPMTARHRRMLQLASRALQEAAKHGEHPVPLLLALPEVYPWGDPMAPGFLEHLVELSGVEVILKQSHVLRAGRAGGLMAVERALQLLATGRVPGVLVGGVDTYLDARLLAMLESEGRLHTGLLPDGFIPGEGAAFLWLAPSWKRKRRTQEPLAFVLSAGSGREPGHRYSEEIYLGEGLTQSFRGAFSGLQAPFPRVRCVYAGLNGERFWTKEWGVAHLRHTHYFEPELRIEHPVEYTGDTGAALGPMMLALAAVGLKKGYRPGPCLVWCSSDREERAAVVLQSVTSANSN